MNGSSGEVMWELGGRSNDFVDLSDGKASDFSWQHDARWLDEEQGLMTLFDNGYAWPHYNAPYSEGRLIKLDLAQKTVELVHSYTSLQQVLSSSQGSVQFIATAKGAQHVFIGWGSSAAYSEFTPEAEILCETYFAASATFWWERVKSYRAFKARWNATPQGWDPSAAVNDNKFYVSWNGATTVAHWVLQGAIIRSDQEQDEWHEVDVREKDGFETTFSVPSVTYLETGASHTRFRAAALDDEHNVFRYLNVVARPPGNRLRYYSVAVFALVCIVAFAASWLHNRRRWHAAESKQHAQHTSPRPKYLKLW